MGILDWVKFRGKEPSGETAPAQHVTNDGNPIKQMWKSEWQPDGHWLYEVRHHVGQSAHGFHGGLEVSCGRGENAMQWGAARGTPEEARNASYSMREGWDLADRTWGEAKYDIPKVDFSKQVPNDKGHVKPIWQSGDIERWVRDGEENDHYRVSAYGKLGQSSEGFHHRLDVTFIHDDFERMTERPGTWSKPLPTQEAASRAMKAAMVAHDREWAAWTGENKDAGSQSIAIVNEAIKAGPFLDSAGDSKNAGKVSGKENKTDIRERDLSWDR